MPGRREPVHLRLRRHRVHRAQLRGGHRRVRRGALPQQRHLQQPRQQLQLQLLGRLPGRKLRDGHRGVRRGALPEQRNLLREVQPESVQPGRVHRPAGKRPPRFRPRVHL